MKPLKPLIFFFSFVCSISFGQSIVNVKLIGTKTQTQIKSTFNIPFIEYGAKFYKVEYTSKDAKGNLDTLSGLMVIPDDVKKIFPMLYYQHGTSDCKTCVPSRYTKAGGEEGELGLLFGGMGFVALLPDYVGMGDGRGFQTYVHAATIASASLDMYDAVKSWLNGDGKSAVSVNDQLFLTGYSQGGYGSMALHKAIEASRPDIKVTATAHLSGPYNLSGVMRNLVLGDIEYNFPAYLPNTLLGFNEIDGKLFSKIEEMFKEPYSTEIQKYYKNAQTLTTTNDKLIGLLKANNNNKLVAGAMINDSIKQKLINDLNHPANVALRTNDLHNWAPKAPTKIYYCKADDQVPHLNSIVAKDTMTALGAANLEVKDVLPTGNHGTCFSPALTNTVLFFLSLRTITSDIAEENLRQSITVYPNPTLEYVAIEGAKIGSKIQITNNKGQLVKSFLVNTDREIISVYDLPSGYYNLTLTSKINKQSTHKIEKI
jgi:S-formylglutathione hydrolase FrmB